MLFLHFNKASKHFCAMRTSCKCLPIAGDASAVGTKLPHVATHGPCWQNAWVPGRRKAPESTNVRLLTKYNQSEYECSWSKSTIIRLTARLNALSMRSISAFRRLASISKIRVLSSIWHPLHCVPQISIAPHRLLNLVPLDLHRLHYT